MEVFMNLKDLFLPPMALFSPSLSLSLGQKKIKYFAVKSENKMVSSLYGIVYF